MSFKPVLRFGVMSDVHYSNEYSNRNERFKTAVTTLYSYAKKQDYSEVDAIYVVGDFADTGTPEQMALFKADCDKYIDPKTMLAITLANHELHYGNGEEAAVADFKRIFNMPTDRHEVIKGFHFISVSTTNDGGKWHDSFDDAKREFLKTELKKASSDTPNMPIFVFQHPGVYNTSPGAAYGNLWIYDLLSPYFNVIDFSGHSHFAANDPREVFQRDFTTVATASIQGLSTGRGWCYKELSGYGYPASQVGQMLIVEVDKDGLVRIQFIDAVAGCVFNEERIIDLSKGKEGFVYTADRTAPPPHFDQKNIDISKQEDGTLITFNRASEKGEKVWYYGLKLFDREDELLKEINIPSDFAMYNQKDIYTYLFPELDKQVISAEVTAVGFFANRSETISKSL